MAGATNWQGAVGSNWVGTLNGRRIDLTRPHPREIDVRDIAAALGNQCRFTGQLKHHYSVAEHCIHVSQIVPPEMALAGLLHDAQEAYIADLSTPMKAEVGRVYRDVEDRIVAALDEFFDMRGQLVKLPDEIKHADRVMLMTERDALFHMHDDWGPLFEATPRLPHWQPLYPDNPGAARNAYLARLTELLELREAA